MLGYNSIEHRKNMLDANFTKLGVASTYDQDKNCWITVNEFSD
jgi:uncharacterized protein YkwD